MSYDDGLDVLGGAYFIELDDVIVGSRTTLGPRGRNVIVLGYFDITDAQRNMNDLKPVVLAVARPLLSGGLSAINGAIAGAKQPWYKSDLPGETARKNVADHLAWHASALSAAAGDPYTTSYASGDDLKKWVMQAYIENNAVEAGSEALNAAWISMWSEIQDALAKIPKAVKQAAGLALDAAGNIIQATTGIPAWLWGVSIAGLVGLVGYGAYKILAGPTGGAIIGGYLGTRRR